MRDAKHLKFIRTLPCCVCLKMDTVQAAHLRIGVPYHEKGGMGMKSHDKWCVPLSAEEHHRQHQIGEKSYWGNMDYPMSLAENLYALSGDREKAIQEILRWNRAFRNQK